jgi:DNA topoisomerase I
MLDALDALTNRMNETLQGRPPGADDLGAAPGVAEVLESTGLAYTSDRAPGIRREGSPPKFRYVDASGRPVKDRRTLERIAKLVLPPAWTEVWICRNPQGHLQATGRDVRGRKQYHYHAKWRKERDSNKFDRLAKFARALPAIRAAVERDLAKPGLPREKVIATMVSLLDRTWVRIGGERYRKENGSFGLTTLRNRHVEVQGERIRIRFRGKSGKEHDIALCDRRIAGIVRRCRDLPGYELFQYVEDGVVRSIGASDVNAYLQDAAGDDYTAKDFRTWGATVVAANAIIAAAQPASPRETTRVVMTALRRAAETLGNTVAVCRKSYVHPGVLNCALAAQVARRRRPRIDRLSADEVRTLAVLVASSQPLEAQLKRSIRGRARASGRPVRTINAVARRREARPAAA